MKSFYRLAAVVCLIAAAIFIGTNISIQAGGSQADGRMYRVEAARLANQIRKGGDKQIDLSGCQYVYRVTRGAKAGGDEEALQAFFEETDSDYLVKSIGGTLYRFDYHTYTGAYEKRSMVYSNLGLAAMALLNGFLLIYIWHNILKPFEKLREIPYELSKGRLAAPLPEQKNRYFGRFIWGVDLLREYMEELKKREMELLRAQKTLVLSVSHDIKTPLSAIKLYAKGILRHMYADTTQLDGIAGSIDAKADEIGEFVSQMAKSCCGDFSGMEVTNGQFYLSALVKKTSAYYEEKLRLLHTRFQVEAYTDRLLRGDFDRSVEVLQNLMENAVKYGDGGSIALRFAQEEDCMLITVANSGNTLPQAELMYIFDSFWRGSNAGSSAGSGLGLSICRQLMHRMGGDVFAQVHDQQMCVTVVFPM